MTEPAGRGEGSSRIRSGRGPRPRCPRAARAQTRPVRAPVRRPAPTRTASGHVLSRTREWRERRSARCPKPRSRLRRRQGAQPGQPGQPTTANTVPALTTRRGSGGRRSVRVHKLQRRRRRESPLDQPPAARQMVAEATWAGHLTRAARPRCRPQRACGLGPEGRPARPSEETPPASGRGGPDRPPTSTGRTAACGRRSVRARPAPCRRPGVGRCHALSRVSYPCPLSLRRTRACEHLTSLQARQHGCARLPAS